MHIAHIQGIFSPEHGGPTQSLANYCRGQVAAGHRVAVWALEGFPQTSPAVRLPAPVEMHVFRVAPPVRLGVSAPMRRALERAGPADIYHLHGAWLRAMHYGARVARRHRRPYLVEMMGMYEPWALRQKWLQKQIARWWFQDRILRGAACLHVNSTQEAEYTRKLGFKAPIAVIPVGVDWERIERLRAGLLEMEGEGSIRHLSPSLSPDEAERVRTRVEAPKTDGKGPVRHLSPSLSPDEAERVRSAESGGFPSPSSRLDASPGLDGRPFILYLSRLHPKKGLDLLIRAFARHRGSGSGNRNRGGWRLVIAGTGPQEYVGKCHRLAEQFGIADQCIWTGHVDETEKSWLFTNAHCYVLPTSSENFGNVVAEALAHGTPVITTRHTPWSEVTERGCGWIVNNTEGELCGALSEAMEMDGARRMEMGRRGRNLVREGFSLELANQRILAVYEWLLDRGPRPGCVA